MNESLHTTAVSEETTVPPQAPALAAASPWRAAAGLGLIGLGLAAVFSPLATGVILAYMITAGLGVYRVAQIVAYMKAPAAERTGSVISGLALTVFSLFTVWASYQTQYSFLAMIAGLSVTVAFFTILRSVSQLFLFQQLRTEGTEGAGWVLAGSVLNALTGVLILANPLTGWLALSTVRGVYLGTSGIVLITDYFSERRRRKATA